MGWCVERKDGDGGAWVEISTNATTPYADSLNLSNNVKYYYRTRYLDSGVYSAYSNEISVTYSAPASITKSLTSITRTNSTVKRTIKKYIISLASMSGNIIKSAHKKISGLIKTSSNLSEKYLYSIILSCGLSTYNSFTKFIKKQNLIVVSVRGLHLKSIFKTLMSDLVISKTLSKVISKTSMSIVKISENINKHIQITKNSISNSYSVINKGRFKILSTIVDMIFLNAIKARIYHQLIVATSYSETLAKLDMLESTAILKYVEVVSPKLEVIPMPAIRNTVVLSAEFRTLSDELYDPETVVLKLYNSDKQQIDKDITVTKVSTGKYEYVYIVDDSGFAVMYYEFLGTLNGKSILGRARLERTWLTQ